MRRRQMRVPNTAQASLGFGQSQQSGERRKVRFGATQFLEATPWHLYVGEERVDRYLSKRGLQWVVKLREELQKVDFSALELNYQGWGRPPYHPRTLLGLFVYGVLRRKSTLREVEELAVTDVGAWWMCGGQQPDHSTLGDFLQRHAQQLTEEYFEKLVKDLVGRKGIAKGIVAGDGTVIEASASRFHLLSREAADKVAQQAQTAAQRQPHDEHLAAVAEQAEQIAAVAAERAEQKERKGREGQRTAVVSPHEPDAVVQRCKDGRRRAAYKPSILVHESGLIVGQALDASSETAVISELFDQHREIFGSDPPTALFDAGYHNLEVLEQAVEREIDLLCPSGTTLDEQWQRRGANGKFAKAQFSYDADSDRYQCPAGQWLSARPAYRHASTGRMVRTYRTAHCRKCELREQCTENKRGREITRFEGDELKDVMDEVMTQPRARARYLLRRQIVERVFAEITCRLGLRRFRRRGLRGAKLEFALHCIAHNLKWAVLRPSNAPVSALWLYLSRLSRRVRERAVPSAIGMFETAFVLPSAA